MPKIKNKPLGFSFWFVVLLLAIVACYFLYHYPYLIFLVPVLYLVVVRENKKYRQKYMELLKNKEGESICDFAKSFDAKLIDTWVIRAVYEELQNYFSDIPQCFQ